YSPRLVPPWPHKSDMSRKQPHRAHVVLWLCPILLETRPVTVRFGVDLHPLDYPATGMRDEEPSSTLPSIEGGIAPDLLPRRVQVHQRSFQPQIRCWIPQLSATRCAVRLTWQAHIRCGNSAWHRECIRRHRFLFARASPSQEVQGKR